MLKVNRSQYNPYDMKKIISILLLTLTLAHVSSAVAQDNKHDDKQTRKERWEKFRQDKHDFFAKTMELTDEQSQQFFPLYEEMEKKCFEAVREVRRETREIMNNKNVSDEKYKAAADRAAALDTRKAEIEREYYTKFCQILTPRQQFLYHRCEHEFQKATINKKHHTAKKDAQRCK